jgi:photosystem II stability/assembly factor-like uncharacterized protein
MKTTFLLLSHLFTCVAIHAQWTKIEPAGGSAQQLLVDGSTIYAGANGTMLKSTDNGQSWTTKDSGIVSGGSNCTGLIKVGSRLVASYGGNGNHYVYYSENNAESWNIDTVNWAPPIIGNIRPFSRITLNYKNTHTICVLESNYILYKSNVDNEWSNMNPPASHRTPNAIHLSGDTVFLYQLRSIDNTCDIIYTTNLGANWDSIPVRSLLNVRGVPYKNKQNETIYIGLGSAGSPFDETIWHSTDNGRTWDSLSARNFNTKDVLASLWADGNLIIAAFQPTNSDTTNKIMMSEDGGITWINITENLISLIPFKFQPIRHLTVIGNQLWLIQGGAFYTRALNANNPTALINTSYVDNIELYPNPAHTHIKLKGDYQHAIITDMNGKALMNVSNSNTTDISMLNTGMYLVKITGSNNEVAFKKLIKQ